MRPNRAIIATGWTGPSIISVLFPGQPEPTQADLDAMADAFTNEAGTRPTVRVIAYTGPMWVERPSEPTPEQVEQQGG